jgi:hypothetical protein
MAGLVEEKVLKQESGLQHFLYTFSSFVCASCQVNFVRARSVAESDRRFDNSKSFFVGQPTSPPDVTIMHDIIRVRDGHQTAADAPATCAKK